MKNNSNTNQDIRDIKNMMERSSRFLSLSGLSGISVGIIALLGVFVASGILESAETRHNNFIFFIQPFFFEQVLYPMLILSLSILILALGSAFLFSWRKARTNGLKLWGATTRRWLINLFIPLIAGGFFILILIDKNTESLVASTSLIFYGLALVNAGKYTFGEIHYLGIFEIVLGILAGVFINQSLFFWAVGFGVLHIIYGLVMYFRYER